MVNDIQKARDVLAKWRDGTTRGPWLYADLGGSQWTVFGAHEDPFDSNIMHADSGDDAHLAVGMTSPDLLDAIDGLLRIADTRMARREEPAFVLHAERIAAAIIAADERMRS